MNKIEIEQKLSAIEKQIAGLQAEQEDLKNLIQNMPDDVPKTLAFEYNETLWFVDGDGDIISDDACNIEDYQLLNCRHRTFKSSEFADEFRIKTQFIADLLFFKQLYDADYVPDFDDWSKNKYFICHSKEIGFTVDCSKCLNINIVYFSTKEIAQKCADWLNSRNGK